MIRLNHFPATLGMKLKRYRVAESGEKVVFSCETGMSCRKGVSQHEVKLLYVKFLDSGVSRLRINSSKKNHNKQILSN